MEMPYVDKPDEDEMVMRDEVSVATEVVDGLSVAPTELLANEYKKLVEQYEEEQKKRKELEQQIETMQTEASWDNEKRKERPQE